MTKRSPFYTDDKTAQAILAAARDHKAQAQNGQVTGTDVSDATTQFQNTCQFKLTADWKELSASNFIASGNKIVPLDAGAEKRPYPTTLYAYGDKPTSSKDSIIVATRRANRWVLLPTGSGGESPSSPQKVRLVQPKELFPACEYKTLQDVYDCTLEYSDDGTDWIPAYFINIVGGRDVVTCPTPDSNPHKYWRVNLKGFSKPEVPNDPYADRGFYTFGRLWEALFWVKRHVETKKTTGETEYTFIADVSDWQINSGEPLPVEFSLSPALSSGELFYKLSTGNWKSLGSFTSTKTVIISAEDIQITVDKETKQERHNTSFQFKVESNELEVANLTLRRPTYTLSPERPSFFSLTESPIVEEANGCTMTAKVTSQWTSSKQQVSVNILLTPPVLAGKLHYRSHTGEWQELGEIYQEKTVSIPEADWDELDDTGNPKNTAFEFAITQNGADIAGLAIPRPSYPLSPDSAEVAMPPPLAVGLPSAVSPWDSKPTPRKAQNHRYWMLTFDQPEVVTKVMLDVDQHLEHYIVCPGGRDAFKQDISFIYSFDLDAERWTATTFPEMQKPMFNMDAKVVELSDKTHQLIVLSGQIAKGFSNIIQGYNFERDYVQNVVDTGEGGLNFAGRPALVGDPMLRNGFTVKYPDGEWDFSRSLIVAGGSERSCFIRGTTSAIDSVLFSIQGSTLAIGMPYETQTLNTPFSNTGHTGLPFGFFDYKTYSSNAGAVGTRLQNMATYTRHQNLPVRGILRRQPKGNTSQPSSSNPVVDFLLIGGFNPVGRETYNNRVVSGIFNSPTASAANSAQYSMLIEDAHFSANNAYSLLYYPNSPYILGDCCAEYVDSGGRDEIICFGGRTSETDTALAHDNLAVLEFNPTSNAAKWIDQKYPPMPHPRWSAASVLIKGLLRKGETEPCDRIFIIGGRNRDGFVAEIDVFNLRYNQWETDWKGLDQGELENYTATGSGSGTTIVIQGGGGDGIQSVKAGDGISITGDSKNPVISANVQDIVNKIIQNETSKTEIAQKITENSSFRNNIATAIINNSTFQEIVSELLLSNVEFKQSIIEAVSNNPVLINSITNALSNHPVFLQNVTQTILGNQAFVDLVIQSVISNATLVSNIVNQLTGSNQFISTVLNQLVSNASFVDAVVSLMLGNASFMATVVQQVTTSQSFINSVKTTILSDATFKTEILENILSNTDFRQDIINALTQSNSLIQNISNTILASSQFITNVTGEILNNETVMNQIVSDVVNNASLINNIVQNIVSNPSLLTNITNEIISNETLVGDIINQVVNHTALHNQITEQVLVSQTFINTVTNQIINNETIINNITQEVVTSQNLFQYITNNVLENNVFINSVTEQIVNHETIVNHITNEILKSETLVQNITEQILVNKTIMTVLTSAIKIIAPDGSEVAKNDEGTLTLQAATNNQFGIVKGQSNTSLATWHNVSAANGTLSINREQLETIINSKDTAIRNAINVRAEDGCIVGQNVDGIIMLPFRYVENEPPNPADGTLYLVKEANASHS